MNRGRPLPSTDTQYKPLMRQYLQIKRRFPDCILFFRLGDFYEMFFEDAVIAARELDLVLTSREKEQPIPMCGIPWFAAEGYIAKLVRRGYKVAICEQVEDPTKARGLVRREVVRVITPGTFLGEDEVEMIYMAAIVRHRSSLGVAFFHPSASTIEAVEISLKEAFHRLPDLWARFPVVEILVPETWSESERLSWAPPDSPASLTWTPMPEWVTDETYARDVCMRHLGVPSLAPFEIEDHPAACIAVGMILHYLEDTQRTDLVHLRTVRYLHPEGTLVLDAATVRNLELVRNLLDGSRQGTLLEVLDQTRTPMGRRLLQEWILAPLRDPTAIKRRLDAVEALYRKPAELNALRDALRTVPDLHRVLGRIGMGTATPKDLARLRQGLQAIPVVWSQLRAWEPVGLLADIKALKDMAEDLADELQRALVDDPPAHTKDGGFIRDGYHAELDGVRAIARDSKRVLIQFEDRERARTGIPTLRVGYNRVFGYYIEVTRAHLHRVPPDYERRQTLTQAERFTTPELKALEEKILTAEERALALEQELYRDLIHRVRTRIPALQAIADRLALLDVLASLAYAALRYRYVRPEIHESRTIVIQGGRHPVLEVLMTDRPFVPNDTHLDPATEQIIVLTGPNMGGKSTYLRQVALICLMAQMGSFVPAEAASIGLVDRIFTRVGATDYLVRGQSTFMVEMLETAHIVRNATPQSLIILDEIGRGTSTFDGMAIAWAVLEYLHNHWDMGPRVVFATHFHELIRLADLYPRVRNYSVGVRETAEGVQFLYRVTPGPCDKSYGVHVARLAGLPAAIINRAEAILQEFEVMEDQLKEVIGRNPPRGETPAVGRRKGRPSSRTISPARIQPSLWETPPLVDVLEIIHRELTRLELDDLSPRQAWALLDRWKHLLTRPKRSTDKRS